MGVLKIRLECQVAGPLADGGAARAAQQWSERTSQALGEQGVLLLRAFPMDKSGRSRGAFRESLAVVRRSPSEVRVPGVQERGTVWAPWLEGVSKRNESTGFKGYRMFRKTRAELQKRAPEIGQRELGRLMTGIGGA